MATAASTAAVAHPPAPRAVRVLQALAVNAVPLWGLARSGWAGSTVLVLYWFETVLGTLLNAVRIALHRRLTHKRGHDGPRRLPDGTLAPRAFLWEYLGIATVFCCAHGVFLAAWLWILSLNLGVALPDPAALRQGGRWLLSAMLLGLGLDLVRLRSQPFAWVRRLRDVAVQRVFVVHLTIILGTVAMAWLRTPAAFFATFAVCKLAVDLVTALGTDEVPERPPGCLVWLAHRLSPSLDASRQWRQTSAAQRAAAARAEETIEPRLPPDS